jgi:Tol biopolymer transport system component
VPNGEDVNRPGDSGELAGEAIRQRLQGAAEPGDPSGAYERVVEKKVSRRIRRRVGTVALSVAVVAGTATGSYALIRAFNGQPTVSPATASSTGFTNGLIAFASEGSIYTARADGTHVRSLRQHPSTISDLAWSPDGSTLAYTWEGGAPGLYVYLIGADGSEPRLIADTDGNLPPQPTWFPDGKSIAYVDTGPLAAARLVAVRLGGTGPRGKLMSTGEACSFSDPAISSNGLIAIRDSCMQPQRSEIEIFDTSGHMLTVVRSTSGADAGPAWAPDGRTLLFGRGGVLYTIRRDGSNLRSLAREQAIHLSYSPDGTKILFQEGTASRPGAIEVMDADGRNIRRLSLPQFATSPSWQPVPVGGVPSPYPVPVTTPGPTLPASSGSPTPTATPTELCPITTVTADFDGDGAADAATVEATSCSIGGTVSWRISVGWGGNHGPAGQWDLPQCTDQYCSAVGSIPMNDGSNALVLRTHEGASTVFYELLNLFPSEAGPKEYTVLDPGSPEFPPGQVAQFPDEGSVTHEDFFRCQGGPYPGGGDQATMVETNATLDKLQGMYTLTETVLAHGPNTGQPELIVVSRNTRQIGFDAFDPAKDVTGVPCWGGATPSP